MNAARKLIHLRATNRPARATIGAKSHRYGRNAAMLNNYALKTPEILLPDPSVDLTRWAVVA
ncbi:MAG: hypothetical protein MR399_10680, partial [Clostridiales bacterium]|nr:hypothetical protein [Clostridiales bacterium]